MAKIMVLCKKKRGCCPSIYPLDANGNIKIGGNAEGFTVFTKEQFEIMVEQAKSGGLDQFLKG